MMPMPIMVLKEGTTREQGKTAVEQNISAGIAISSAVRSTLGPRGMDKMLVDADGKTIITNDGVTILKEVDVSHPAARMVVEAAKTQDDECGDGREGDPDARRRSRAPRAVARRCGTRSDPGAFRSSPHPDPPESRRTMRPACTPLFIGNSVSKKSGLTDRFQRARGLRPARMASAWRRPS